MKILNKRYVQIWEDTRLRNTILVNHMWREEDELARNGFRLYFQEVSASELELVKMLESSKDEEENSTLLSQMSPIVLKKLLEYKFIVDSDDEILKSNIWFSQAGQYLYIYLRNRYKLLYPEWPSRVLFLPTMRCNGNCVFCITNSKITNNMLEFTADSWKKITHRVIHELKPMNIDIVGGEPLLRSDAVFEIVKELADTNIVLKLITNGENLNKYEVERLAPYLNKMHHNIQISLDSMQEGTKKIRPGLRYENVVEGIKLVSKHNLNFGINITITKLNIDEIDQIVEFINQYHPIYITFGPLQVSVKAPEYCKKIMLNIEEETKLRDKVQELKAKYKHIIFNFDKKEYPYIAGEKPLGNKKKLHTCTGFLEEMTIYSDGHILPCLRSTAYESFFGPNILDTKESLQKVWLDSEIAQKYRTILLKEPCASCGYNQQCNQGCPLETYELDGIFGGYDPHCTYNTTNMRR